MAKKFITTGAFPEPKWTQVPNKFFDMLPEMEASEALTTLILIRETYGYHRPTCKMSISKIAAAAGISENSVKTGAEMAEKRGTFRRSNPNDKKSAEWELAISSTIDPSMIDPLHHQPLTIQPSTIDPQVGIKEIKENKEKTAAVFSSYQSEFGAMTAMTANMIGDDIDQYSAAWCLEAMQIAVEANVRKWNYVRGILRSCEAKKKSPLTEKREKTARGAAQATAQESQKGIAL